MRTLPTTKQHQRGFTIFLAVLISSLALAVGVAIYDLTIRELDLTIADRESQYAVYAADTGVECALYWDAKYSTNTGTAFATSSLDAQEAAPGSGVTCNGFDITNNPYNILIPPNAYFGSPVPWVTSSTNNAATTTFQFSMVSTAGAISKPCVQVIVAKWGTPQKTTITSNGFNNCVSTSPGRLERTIQVTY